MHEMDKRAIAHGNRRDREGMTNLSFRSSETGKGLNSCQLSKAVWPGVLTSVYES